MKVLLIFELVPEKTYAYLIEDPTTDELKTLLASAGVYVGLTSSKEEEAPVMKVNEWIAEHWKKFNVDADKPIRGPIDHAVICGFVL